MSCTIYRKVNRRYIPVGLYDSERMYLPNGTHLVVVKDGCTSTRYNISVDEAVVLAAVQNVRKSLIDALAKAVVMQPSKRELNALEQKGRDAYIDIAGLPVMIAFEGVSTSDIVDKVLEVLKEELKEKSNSCEAQDHSGIACGKINNF